MIVGGRGLVNVLNSRLWWVGNWDKFQAMIEKFSGPLRVNLCAGEMCLLAESVGSIFVSFFYFYYL